MHNSRTNESRFVNPGRVLEGVRPVDVEEASTVGAELLDRFHEADRSDGDGLGHAVQSVVYVDRTAESLHSPCPTKMSPPTKAMGNRT